MKPLLPGSIARGLVRSRLARAILIASIAGLLARPAPAQTLTWDSNPAIPGAQTGNGAWNGGNFWFDGTSNVPWTSGGQAIFTGAPIVDAGGITVDDITFNGSGSLATLQLGASGGALTLGGGNGVHSLTVTATDGQAQITLPLAGTQGLQKAGAGVLALTNPSNSFSGAVSVIGGGALSVTDVADAGTNSGLGAGSTVTLGDNLSGGRLIFANAGSNSTNRAFVLGKAGGTIEVAAGGALTLSAAVTGGGLTKTGPGTLTLNGALALTGMNTGGGQFTDRDLWIQDGKVTISSFPVGPGVLINSTGTLELLASTTIRELSSVGFISLGVNTLTLTGLNAGSSGVISGSGGLVVSGPGASLYLSGSSTFTGGVTVGTGGQIVLTSVADIGTPSPLGADGTITMDGSSLYVSEPGNYSTNRRFDIHNGVISIGNNTELALTGVLNGSGTWAKTGVGRLTIGSDQSFAASITTTGGTLRLAGSLPNSTMIVTGGTLESSGERTVGNLTLTGGTIAPGLSGTTAVLHAGAVDLNGGILSLDIASATSFDSVDAIGTVTLDGPTQLVINLSYDPADFVGQFEIITNDGSDPTILNSTDARFRYNENVLEDGEIFLVQSGAISQQFEIQYGSAGGDNDVRLVVAPEPSSLLFVLAAGMLLHGRRRDGARG